MAAIAPAISHAFAIQGKRSWVEVCFALVVATRMLEGLAHAKAHIGFGTVLDRVLVSPRFHRLHHAAGDGGAQALPADPQAHNFAVLFPLWDMLFGTARFDRHYGATCIADQWLHWGGRSYGEGFWQQQRLGLARLRDALAPRRRS